MTSWQIGAAMETRIGVQGRARSESRAESVEFSVKVPDSATLYPDYMG
jgi:hypothetical protein